MEDMVVVRKEGLYCVPGDFYIDPWRPVARAVITHAHADHARPGHGHYLAAAPGAGILRARLGADISLQALPYEEIVRHNGVQLSLHPAGHVLGSAQLRMEHQGRIWVASGDYKLEADGTCAPFAPVRCHTFITESTFGMPIYRWQPQQEIFDDINRWWRANAAEGRASVLFCYAFGKAQRILHGIDAGIGPIVCHGAVEPLNRLYREAGVHLPDTLTVGEAEAGKRGKTSAYAGALVIAPPSAAGSPWIRRFGDYSDGFASGWMRLRGTRRRRGVDRGFVLSDHADWPALQQAIAATGAQRVIVTHGQVATMVRWLRQNGLDAGAFSTEYGDEQANEANEADDGAAPAPPPQERSAHA
ncbi:putative mRNA 3-end processing factor [Herbaspirillum rubrisubalbicans]|uniref:ligase-associated DNA damage response exonuclease n=1 Tax=Herbaspirillum rubrisubalbicans TaxID=80842 RepID=UPI0020A180A5|nr:ligase-associated DNA damage response exonuclease [Herbaspirillum rubrisubalbicans]MCP1572762.1 putative mRNA 3-end processing factor [Herbaspirillum rubrisubalbicans]